MCEINVTFLKTKNQKSPVFSLVQNCQIFQTNFEHDWKGEAGCGEFKKIMVIIRIRKKISKNESDGQKVLKWGSILKKTVLKSPVNN